MVGEVHIQLYHQVLRLLVNVVDSVIIEIHNILGNIKQIVFLNGSLLFTVFDVPELVDVVFLGFQWTALLDHLLGKPIELDQLLHVDYSLIEEYKNTVHFSVINDYQTIIIVSFHIQYHQYELL